MNPYAWEEDFEQDLNPKLKVSNEWHAYKKDDPFDELYESNRCEYLIPDEEDINENERYGVHRG